MQEFQSSNYKFMDVKSLVEEGYCTDIRFPSFCFIDERYRSTYLLH